jgi:two-component system, NarL family, sensor histidine kinase UhpB
MSIRFRLNALMVSLLSLALIAFVTAMIMSAGPRIQAENESIMRLSKEFVETAVESLQGTSNPGARLAVLLEGLKNLRHVYIYRADEPGASEAEVARETSPESSEAPAWLARLAQPTPQVVIPVFVNGQSFGDLVIAPKAGDESAEIWDSIVKFTVIGTALTAATLLLLTIMIARLLKPIRTVGDALLQLDGGSYDVAVPETGPPEISDICGKLNRLAATLKTTTAENRRLAKRIIRIQDDERKDLARELHDELGPYLFAIRAGATTLKADAERGGTDKAKLVRTCNSLLEGIETMQNMNRRVLHKLRPIGLEEFGLPAKLTSLIAMWRESRPDVSINLTVADDIAERDETCNLTIFRIVQEGLTNAFRHADATAIEVKVEPVRANSTMAPGERRPDARPSIRITVSDNGKGLVEEARPSYGIAGMTERVWALGGEMRIFNGANGGLTLQAWVPAAGAVETDRRNEAPQTH